MDSDDLIVISQAELARALADTVLLPNDSFNEQASKIIDAIIANTQRKAETH